MSWTCPVCGEPGKRTREHVFGKWLSDLFNVRKQRVTVHSSRAGRLWSSRGLGVVVDVCAICNNGWMSDLERRFSAAFSRSILGDPAMFNAKDLEALAHWASKMAIMLQSHLAGMHEASHVPSGHLASLPFGPPTGTRVWLGGYAPVTRFTFWQNVPMAPGDAPLTPGTTHTGYMMLMTIGHMMLVVLGVESDDGDDITVVGLPDRVFRPIWPLPAEPVRWPEGLVLNDRGIATFWPPKLGALVAYGSARP